MIKTLAQIVFGPSEYIFKLYTVRIKVWDAEEEEIDIKKRALFLFYSVIFTIFKLLLYEFSCVILCLLLISTFVSYELFQVHRKV